jgi:DMSO/TMAO reductase YedYZ heme-binding membrane subunit
MSPQMWWYVARASGIVAWLMLSASVIWGIVLASGAFPSHRRPAWLLDLHRWLGALTVGFLGLHLGALVADSYVDFGLADLVVPLASDWKPMAVAAGVVAMWSIVAVQASSLLRKRIPKWLWRSIHLSSYPTFLLVSAHGIFAGTDASTSLYLTTTVLTVVAVSALLVQRMLGGTRKRRGAAGRRVGTDLPTAS